MNHANSQLNSFAPMGAQSPSAQMAPTFLTAKMIRARVQAIQEVMKEVMVEGQHFYAMGVRKVKLASGEEKEDPNFALSKSGAEVLCMTFQLAPDITSTFGERDEVIQWKSRRKEWYNGPKGRDFEWKEEKGETDGYYEVLSTCRIYGPGGVILASAQGSANNLEAKNRTQNLADIRNTILKMSQKRAFVAAVLLATGASDLFTQDLEDGEDHPLPLSQQPKPAGTQSSTQGQPSGTSSAGGGVGNMSEKQVFSVKTKADKCGMSAPGWEAFKSSAAGWDKGETRGFMDKIMSGKEDIIREALATWLKVPSDAAPTPPTEG